MKKPKTVDISRLYFELGFRIRIAREAKHIRQQTLADHIGLSRGSVANIELGRQRPGLHVIYQIASALSVRPSMILPALTDCSNA
jgi:transcriptional regulator with XRE-family HTH domain